MFLYHFLEGDLFCFVHLFCLIKINTSFIQTELRLQSHQVTSKDSNISIYTPTLKFV